MKHFTSIFLRTVVTPAVALAIALGSAGPALAGPLYHVTIDTGTLSGQSGWLDFLFMGLDGATPVEASVSHLAGALGSASFASGQAGGSAGAGITIGNGDTFNEFGQWADFGGLFSFDVAFDTAATPGAGSTLAVALLDADWNYLGAPGDIVTFSLQAGRDDAITAAAGIASVGLAVNAVPEPSTAWLGAAGLLLMGGMLRRRRSSH
jgi:hypothetical protein